MARNSVSNTVLEAAQVQLICPIKLFANNTYVLSTNFISWGDSHNYNLTGIAKNFGIRRTDCPTEIIGGAGDPGFTCGDGSISAFDFGLLYTAFTAMIMAKVELGTSFYLVSEATTREHVYIAWFGNDGIVYSVKENVILPLKNADIERACSGGKISINNFCSRDSFTLEREGNSFVVSTQNKELYLRLNIPDSVRRTYAMHFTANEPIVDNPLTSWDEGSMLGMLIGETDSRSECLDVLSQYQQSSIIDTIVAREDLIVVPTERYSDTANFFGSICYTDKEEIAVAVNFRHGLFVYYPWFSLDKGKERDIKIDQSAKFPEFYNVTDGCNRILRYAETVVNRPLTAAQFDVKMFESIKNAFLEMKLPRLAIKSVFGKIVIPESVLVEELTAGNGEALYCILPVGIVGSRLVCISSEDNLTSVVPNGWDFDSAFYDITEVALNAQH